MGSRKKQKSKMHGPKQSSKGQSSKGQSRYREERFSLDLHGFTVVQAIECLENHLSKVLLAEVNQFEVIHGIGTGAVKKAVHEYLSSSPHVRRFSISEYNPGSSVVYL